MINWKGLANWIGSAALFGIGTGFLSVQLVPGMNWKQTLAVACSTAVSSAWSHMRQHPFQG